jgi:diguanylate cyclase (GGDEF)-like protein
LARIGCLVRESVRPLRLALYLPPDVEEAFEQDRRRDRIVHYRYSMAEAIVLYNVFAILDYFFLKQRFGISVATRLGFATPIALVCYAIITRVGKRMRETLFAASPIPAMIGALYIYNLNREFIAVGQIALIIMMMYSNAMRPCFRYVCCVIPVEALGDTIFLVCNRQLDAPRVATYTSLIWTAAFLSLLASQWIEQQERTGYLLRLQVQTQNKELVRISTMDPLTGIANRRYLDNRLRTMWQESIAFGHPISALMIDLDHFKKINDSYGHEYGDTVLCLVARALRDTLRGEQDVVARYGGEEFVAILPNRWLESARSIAERLRIAVRKLTLPPVDAELHPRITISIGVASLTPAADSNQTNLLRAADEALYEAKDHGRNRVWP